MAQLRAGRNVCKSISYIRIFGNLRIVERSCGSLVHAHRMNCKFGERRQIPRRRKVEYIGTVMHSRRNLYARKRSNYLTETGLNSTNSTYHFR